MAWRVDIVGEHPAVLEDKLNEIARTGDVRSILPNGLNRWTVVSTDAGTTAPASQEDAWALLKEVEWGGRVWTDTAICLFCSAHRDPLPAVGELPAEPGQTHKPDCRWLSVSRKYEPARAAKEPT